jgi:hypothetical protein
MEGMLEASPHPTPRTIGLVWLLYFLTALFGALLTKGLVVSTDAVATATNLLAHQSQYRAGVAVGLFANALYVALTALLYGLFAPVNRSVSLTAAFFSLVGCTVQIVAGMLQLAPLPFLLDSNLESAFTAAQLRAAALISLKLYAQTFHISFVMFALFNVMLGSLIYRSTFVPRIFGVFFLLAGLGSLSFFWPPLATALWLFILPFSGFAEMGLTLWLLVKGVDVARWRERVRTETY